MSRMRVRVRAGVDAGALGHLRRARQGRLRLLLRHARAHAAERIGDGGRGRRARARGGGARARGGRADRRWRERGTRRERGFGGCISVVWRGVGRRRRRALRRARCCRGQPERCCAEGRGAHRHARARALADFWGVLAG
eukprot:6206690-Pleurochrysis_carterae.AAC.1